MADRRKPVHEHPQNSSEHPAHGQPAEQKRGQQQASGTSGATSENSAHKDVVVDGYGNTATKSLSGCIQFCVGEDDGCVWACVRHHGDPDWHMDGDGRASAEGGPLHGLALPGLEEIQAACFTAAGYDSVQAVVDALTALGYEHLTREAFEAP